MDGQTIHKKRILVVDPDKEFCRSVRLYLEDEYQVTSRQGLEYVDYTLLLNQIDILVIDADYSNKELATRLTSVRHNHPQLKIVVMYTYFASNKNEELSLARAADDLIAKPFDVQDLKLKLDNLLPLTA